MRYDVVSIFDALAGRMIAGVLNLSSSHPVAVGLMLAVLMILVCSFWLEMMGVRLGGTSKPREPDSTAAPRAR